MVKKLLILVLILGSVITKAQVTNEGQPISWSFAKTKSSLSSIKLPKINYREFQKQNDVENSVYLKPYRFGYKHKVNYGLNNSGEWIDLPNGSRVWKVLFESSNAKSLNFIFNTFYLPKGGKLYLYNEDRSDLLGAYTNLNNNKNGLSTWIVKGNKVWIEYYEPKEALGKGKLNISHITHGYKSLNIVKTLGESGDCNHDVDCPIASDFASHRDYLKKSVALLLFNGQDWCTGTLLNNTNQDKTPYILTGDHCLFNNAGVQQGNPSFISARFNWISPNPVCADITSSTNGPTNFTLMNGAELIAHNSNSDFLVIKNE